MKTFYTWLHNMLRPSRAQHVPAGMLHGLMVADKLPR